MRKLFQERKLFKGGNYMRKYYFSLVLREWEEKKLQIFRTLVNGMHFLHNSTQLGVHGNLRTSNCLVTSRWQLQITDFGLRELRATADEESEGYSFRYHPYITWSFLISVWPKFGFGIGIRNSVLVSGTETKVQFRYRFWSRFFFPKLKLFFF